MKIRINNIECRKYTATKTDEVHYEIVKWENNTQFGKEKEYRDNGYVDSFGGDFLQKNGHSIQNTFFERQETCYTVASLNLNMKEPCVYTCYPVAICICFRVFGCQCNIGRKTSY